MSYRVIAAARLSSAQNKNAPYRLNNKEHILCVYHASLIVKLLASADALLRKAQRHR